MKDPKRLLLLLPLLLLSGTFDPEVCTQLPPGNWHLEFSEEFTGTDEELDAVWNFQNGPSGHILSSRWRDNAVMENGSLKLIARREERGGQAWTAANLWSKRKLRYGYYECRYRYAAATGTNNSFWLMARSPRRSDPGQFEIDINEGHYPHEINTNIHNWSGVHWSKQKSFRYTDKDLSAEYHVYGLEWNPNRLVWYFDGTVIREEPNTIFHEWTPVWLSLAILEWAGPLTDDIDGSFMDVDYVRVYYSEQTGG